MTTQPEPRNSPNPGRSARLSRATAAPMQSSFRSVGHPARFRPLSTSPAITARTCTSRLIPIVPRERRTTPKQKRPGRPLVVPNTRTLVKAQTRDRRSGRLPPFIEARQPMRTYGRACQSGSPRTPAYPVNQTLLLQGSAKRLLPDSANVGRGHGQQQPRRSSGPPDAATRCSRAKLVIGSRRYEGSGNSRGS